MESLSVSQNQFFCVAWKPKSHLNGESPREARMAKLWHLSSLQEMYGNSGSSFYSLSLFCSLLGTGEGLDGHPRARSFVMGGSDNFGMVEDDVGHGYYESQSHDFPHFACIVGDLE
jgi:hypothetical protein